VLLALAAVLAVRIVSFPQTLTSGRYDCAIVLGAAVHGTSPSPVFEARIAHAIDLYRQGLVQRLVFTGGVGAGAQSSEAAVAEAYAVSLGVPAQVILTEQTSHTTRQNLVEAKRIMDAAGLRSAVIVSDPYHLRRSASMATDLGMQATTSATPTTRYQSLSTKAKFLTREVYFIVHYWVLNE
jgi:uncharacterized SAM-binding protein YcdF (DUF218 family)